MYLLKTAQIFAAGIAKLALLQIIISSRALPLRFRYLLTDLFSFIAYLLFPSKRQAVKRNLQLVLGRNPLHREIAKVFREYGTYWAELADISNFWAQNKHHFSNPEFPPKEKHFLGLTFHIGNFEVFGQLLSPLYNENIKVVAERLHPDFLTSYFRQCRLRHKIETIQHDDTRAILKALRGGGTLGVVCDRSIDDKGIGVELFGKRTRLPLNIMEAALRYRIPVYVAYCIKDKGALHIEGKRIPADSSMQDAVSLVTTSLEDAVRRYPYQWHVLSPV